MRALSCFSVKRNGTAILNLDEGTTGDSLSMIHGLRVMTMAWIILGHTYGLVNPQIHSESHDGMNIRILCPVSDLLMFPPFVSFSIMSFVFF